MLMYMYNVPDTRVTKLPREVHVHVQYIMCIARYMHVHAHVAEIEKGRKVRPSKLDLVNRIGQGWTPE